MGYIPKFIHLDYSIDLHYPFGIYWRHDYIQKCTDAVCATYREDIERGVTIAFVARGTSGAMIAGAMLNELHHINSSARACILIVRKDEDVNSHCSSLRGFEELQEARFIVVDDFIQSGETIKAILKELDLYFSNVYLTSRKKYDMLCISNSITADALKKNRCTNYRKWKEICSRFKYVVCCPKSD